MYSQIKFINHINEKSWFFEDEFAGSTLIIYEAPNRIYKAIRQIHGSGIPVLASEIYDIDIVQNEIHLLNGINLKSMDKLNDKLYKYNLEKNQLINNAYVGKNQDDKVVLYSWAENNNMTKIDFRKLKSIPIGFNEIYKMSEIQVIELK